MWEIEGRVGLPGAEGDGLGGDAQRTQTTTYE